MAWIATALLLGCAHAPVPSSGHGARDDTDGLGGSSTSGEAGPVAAPSSDAHRAGAAASPATIRIATGARRETDYRVGLDLAALVAPDAGVDLAILQTRGSADNLHRLSDDGRVDLAIVQYDVVQALIDEAARGNTAARRLVEPLRVVTPLYTQEVYVVVRQDSPMRTIADLKGRRINLGAAGSGSALTAASLYRKLFGATIASNDAVYLSDDEALAALTVDRSVDAVVVVAAQPAALFADMKPAARRYIKLLPFDPKAPTSRDALKVYFLATIHARSYPTWLAADVPTLSVMSFLFTTERHDETMAPELAAFAHALCTNLPRLQAEGHPKWREVALGERFGLHWPFARSTARAFSGCANASR